MLTFTDPSWPFRLPDGPPPAGGTLQPIQDPGAWKFVVRSPASTVRHGPRTCDRDTAPSAFRRRRGTDGANARGGARGRHQDRDGEGRNRGGRCGGLTPSSWGAGSPARPRQPSSPGAGLEVLVVERATEFVDRVRGEYLVPWGLAEAEALGLTDVVMSVSHANVITEVTSFDETIPVDEAVTRSFAELVPGVPGSLGVSHPGISEAVLTHAVSSGAELWRGVERVEVTVGTRPVGGLRPRRRAPRGAAADWSSAPTAGSRPSAGSSAGGCRRPSPGSTWAGCWWTAPRPGLGPSWRPASRTTCTSWRSLRPAG